MIHRRRLAGSGWRHDAGTEAHHRARGHSAEAERPPYRSVGGHKAELNARFTLVYTGQRRLARNLLRDVVGRYISNAPDSLYALEEIQRIAVMMAFELERGHVDDFAKLLNRHWELSKTIDAGSTNTCIDQIFLAIDDLIDGRMICGAGGGGFLQVLLKRGVTREQLNARLHDTFQDCGVDVWDCTLV